MTESIAREVTLARAGDTLRGTLLEPPGQEGKPVVLIHPGSGPTDRNGNSAMLPGENNSLRLLAEGLAERGIASLRIDKRGIGGSTSRLSESDLRLETYADDAAAWLRMLREQGRFDPVVALGHSEGALITALAVTPGGADGYVSLAGVASRGSDVLRAQLKDKLPPDLLRESERILASLERGAPVEQVPEPLMALYRPGVQPYLISWFRHVPAEVMARLPVPVLIAQGSADLQVSSAEAAALRAARPDARYLEIPGMNHVLKPVAGTLAQQLSSYSDPNLPVPATLLDGVCAFVRGLPGRTRG